MEAKNYVWAAVGFGSIAIIASEAFHQRRLNKLNKKSEQAKADVAKHLQEIAKTTTFEPEPIRFETEDGIWEF